MQRKPSQFVTFLPGVGVLLAFIASPLVFTPTDAGEKMGKTRLVLLKVAVDLKDPTLEFLLDDRAISAKTLQAPVQLKFGAHELMVLRDAEPVDVFQFDVGPKTPAEIVLKRPDALPPADNEPDFPQARVNAKISPPPDPKRAEQRRKGEWVQLFNGKDLAGWRMRAQGPGNWRVEDGVLICDGGKFGHLFTAEDDWTDVHLRLVARANPGAAVGMRAPYNGTPGDECYHVVIGGSKKRPSGSLLVAGRDTGQVEKNPVPPNTWYTLEVIVRGHHVVTKINGEVAVDYEDANKTYKRGFIVLNHPFDKRTVEFKSIEARDLAPERLIAKPRMVPPKSADHGKHALHLIQLPDAIGKPPHVMIARAPGGGFKLGWNDAKGRAHITTLSEDLKPGADIVVPDTDLRGLAVNDDGAVMALAFQAPCQSVALGFGPDGSERFKTVLDGQNGNGPGTRFSMKWWWKGRIFTSGQDFAVYFGHFNHLKGGAKHQGGCYARLDSKGKILQYDGWTVSHCIDQALFFHRDAFLAVAVGDAFPLGIAFGNPDQRARSLLYPAKEERDAFRPKRTILGNMLAVESDVAFPFVTYVGESWRGFFVVLDTVGEVRHFTRVLDNIAAAHAAVSAAPYGSDYLLIWTESEKSTRYVRIDGTGRFLAKSTLVEEPIGRRNDLALFANGDVGWLTAAPGASEVKLVRVKW